MKKTNVCVSFKADRVSYVSDAIFRGMQSADFHSKSHLLTERRASAPKYSKPGKHDLAGPAFLRQEVASKLISPVSYDA